MMFSSALLSLLLVTLSPVSATLFKRGSSKFSLAFAARVNLTGSSNVAESDRARAATLRSNALAKKNGKRDGIVTVTNTAITYTASIGIGNPATQYTLLIDTGSSNTWIGADKEYTPTSSSLKTGDTVSVTYGSGSFSGDEFIDIVTLAKGLVINQQSIGVASEAEGFDGVDGILGIGPVGLTETTLSSGEAVPTVTDNLFSDGTISSNLIGVFYVPAAEPDSKGELDFGITDSDKFSGNIAYVPITNSSPASEYWGIDQSISYDGNSILDSTSGIVDTGTTLVLLASDAFSAYERATGGSLDQTTGLLKISSQQYSDLKDLDFNIGLNTYTLSPNAQIWPRSLNAQIGGDNENIYLVVADIGSSSGNGLDFIDGYAFLERFYSVYDTENKQVGFALTQFTDATSN